MVLRIEQGQLSYLIVSVCVPSHVPLWDPMDCSLSSSSVHGISQARMLEWVAFPSSGDLPEPRIEPGSLALQANSLPSELTAK